MPHPTDKILERVRVLVDIASRATTPIEEARSAALEACRAIARHGLRLTDRVLDEVGQDARFKDAVERAVEERIAELHRARGAEPTAAEREIGRAVAKGAGKAAEKLTEEGLSWLFERRRR